jgi:acyl dehydratase
MDLSLTERGKVGGRNADQDRGMNVGDVAERTRRVEAEDIERFTAMTGDRNPLHYDVDAATRSRFGGIIVQGGVTTGLLNALVAEDLPGPGSVFLNVNWNFRAPARPGDVITARGEITSVHATKPVCTMQTTITNHSGEVLVDGSAVVYREPLS